MRDARNRSHMDPETLAIHGRLEEWGKWHREAPRPVEPGALPEIIANTDAAVASLGEIDQRTLRAYYMRTELIDLCAHQQGMRLRQFRNVLHRARWKLMVILAKGGDATVTRGLRLRADFDRR